MKSYAILTIWLTISIVVVFAITLSILAVSWRNNANDLWTKISIEQSKLISDSVNDHLDMVEFASRFVPSVEDMLKYYVMYDVYSGYRFTSMGLLTRATNTSNGKYSWQIATYKPACPIYGYFYSDQTIYNNFYGYCATTTSIDYSNITYRGYDWGLKPEEAQLVDGLLEETYLPIFNLLGDQTLTHEWKQPTGGLVSFAELNLQTLSNYLRQNTSLVAMIQDNKSGDIIATSSDYTTFQGWTVLAVPIKRTGLSWTVYVGVENIYEEVNQKIALACGIAAAMAIIVIFLTFVGTYFWISKPIANWKNDGLVKSYTPIDDFQ